MFRSLHTRNYRLWFFGAIVSNIGGWMQATTQDWVVLTELTHHDAAAVGVTMALQFGPQLALVPLTGAVIDRFDRRRILLCTQTALMLLAIGLGVLLLSGHAQLWHVYGFALALGIANSFDAPARQTFVSDLVSGANTSNAVALNAASFNVSRLIGPATAGLLIVVVGSGWVFLLNAATFLALIGALLAMRRSELVPRPRRRREGNGFTAGFRYVASRSDLAVVFTIVFLIGAFGMNFPIFASTMAVLFGQDAGGFGVISSILAIGSLTAALLAARRDRARLRVVVIAAGGFGFAALAASLMPAYGWFAASTVPIGFAIVTMLSTANGYVQTTTDADVRGRVMALYTAVLMGSTLIGAPIVGWVANTFGARWGLGVAAASGFLACAIGLAWAIRARGMRIERIPRSRWGFGVAWAGATDAIADGDLVAVPGAVDALTGSVPVAPRSSTP
ncbi:MFS transporter [Agromyces sp. MMS24-JH15]|uniref:MFS transporter n=1 Tax=Agromyces sp. MMS24-JH15 TaxID=3243765 RepID=UPI00374851F8